LVREVGFMEFQVAEERSKRETEGAEKTRKVEELEREIAQTIDGQVRENRELKERLVDNGMYMRLYQEAESLVKSHMS
jgi:hypothetical protein